jgi:N-sulfoglucosamine sulfohydrolase
MNRRNFLATAAAAAGPRQARQRNVLLLVADDQGLDLGCYGNAAIATPHLDALAASATRFPYAFSTVSSCSPSRSVMYTGLYTHTSGQYGLAHDFHNQHTLESVESLPLLLKKAGYATACIGKKHVKPDEVYAFDYALEGREIAGNRDVAAMARKAGDFLAAHRDRPFLLIVGYSDPHRAALGFANTRDYPGTAPRRYAPAAVRLPYHLPDLPEVRADLADYYQAVSRLDAGAGLALQALRDSGRENDTLVIYLSDNGIPFPGAKTNLYDAGVRLPFLVRAPGLSKAGSVSNAMISYVDVAPTILDWTGVPGPTRYTLPGRSLLPALEENPRGWDEVYGSHTFHEITMYYPMRMARTRRYKYLRNLAHQLPYPLARDILDSASWKAMQAKKADLGSRSARAYFERPAEELYDLEKDPDELDNVAGDAAYAKALQMMREKLAAFRRRTNDPWLLRG